MATTYHETKTTDPAPPSTEVDKKPWYVGVFIIVGILVIAALIRPEHKEGRATSSPGATPGMASAPAPSGENILLWPHCGARDQILNPSYEALKAQGQVAQSVILERCHVDFTFSPPTGPEMPGLSWNLGTVAPSGFHPFCVRKVEGPGKYSPLYCVERRGDTVPGWDLNWGKSLRLQVFGPVDDIPAMNVNATITLNPG